MISPSKLEREAGVNRATASRYLKGLPVRGYNLELLQEAHVSLIKQAYQELIRLAVAHHQNKES